MGMVALLNSSSGIRVISRMGPTMPGMKQILWLPEKDTHIDIIGTEDTVCYFCRYGSFSPVNNKRQHCVRWNNVQSWDLFPSSSSSSLWPSLGLDFLSVSYSGGCYRELNHPPLQNKWTMGLKQVATTNTAVKGMVNKMLFWRIWDLPVFLNPII